MHQKASVAMCDHFRHTASTAGDHRRTAGHRLDDGEPKRLVEMDRVQQRIGAAQEAVALFRSYTTKINDAPPVDMRLDFLREIGMVLHDSGHDEWHAKPLGDLNRFLSAFVWVDATKEEQVRARLRMEG